MSLAVHDDHHPPRSPHLAEHFDTLEQQHNAAKLGMWLFLITEILLFSGLFLAYTTYRWLHPEVFKNASMMLNIWMGTINTLVLIGSSLTMALGVRAAQLNQKKQTTAYLAATLICAGIFMVVKYFEYSEKFHHGIYPGKWFHPDAEYALSSGHDWLINMDHARTFFSIYFLSTGLHGFHVLGGMVVIGWLLLRSIRGDFNSSYYTPVEVVGLYWHIVDIIWIFLFPMLYLVDRVATHG